jgi:cytochrome oxidase Cu insertion factor (SCO1/SenC/PrrC family)
VGEPVDGIGLVIGPDEPPTQVTEAVEPQEGSRSDLTPPIDRAAALAAGAPGVPRKFAYWVLAAAVVLSLGGLLGEHLFSAAGLNPTPTTDPTTTTAPPVVAPAPLTGATAQPVTAPLTALMGLTSLPATRAPAFTLVDQDGQPATVPSGTAGVVVLTFFDGSCNDICPVLAAEIRQADADLGAQADRVEFLTVNTDPRDLATSGQAPAGATGLSGLANWRMLTGPLASLNAVWKAYGVTVSVDEKTGLEAHSDVVYFIDPAGDLRFRATPFADESTTGAYSLAPATVARWATGIATYAAMLITP